MRWSLLLAAVLVLFISLISAQAPSATTTTPTTTLLVTGASSTASPSAAYYRYIKTLYELSPSAIASGVFFLLGGMTLLFFGYRLFKPMLFLAGMYTVMILSFVILTKLEPDDGYSNPDAVLFWPPMALGLLGGGLALFLYRVGLVCLGLLGGFSLSLFLLSLRSQGLIHDETGRAVFIGILSLIGAVIIHFFERPLIIVCCCIVGSLSIAYGIDTYARVGYIATIRLYTNAGASFSTIPYEVTWQVGLLIGTTVILFIIGLVAQFKINRGRDHRDERSGDKEDGF